MSLDDGSAISALSDEHDALQARLARAVAALEETLSLLTGETKFPGTGGTADLRELDRYPAALAQARAVLAEEGKG